MKQFLSFLLIFINSYCWGQIKTEAEEENVLKTALTDKSNYSLMEFYKGDKIPKVISVLSKPAKWSPRQFWLEGISDNKLDSNQIAALRAEEHHPYNHVYIFRSLSVDSLFNLQEKKYLYENHKLVDTTKLIHLKSDGLQIIPSEEKTKARFIVSTTWPLFSQDKQIAFVGLNIFRREKVPGEPVEYSLFGYNVVIYRKSSTGLWIKLDDIGLVYL